MMTEIEEQTRLLIDAMKRDKSFLVYQELKNKLHEDPERLEVLNSYRRESFRLQTSEEENVTAELISLNEEYEALLMDDEIHEFLKCEQNLCSILQYVMTAISEAAELDLDFL